jgi:predicted ATPase
LAVGLGGDEDKQLAQELMLRAVELGMSPALGGDVRLELAPGTTVLVGKNGAGKSAILERISQGFDTIRGIGSQPDPGRFACEWEVHESGVLRYQYIWHLVDSPTDDLMVARQEETCTLADPEQRELWRTEDGELVRVDTSNKMSMIRKGRESLEWIEPLTEWAASVHRIAAGVAREVGNRGEIMLPARRASFVFGSLHPLHSIAYRLVRWQQTFPEEFDELRAVGARTKLFHQIEIQRYADPDQKRQRDFLSVMIDGINLGLVSDGTLRAIQIFMGLLQPQTRLLLIDEPESAAHPGLLASMLAEIEAYSTDRQIVISTQSPQVVSWAHPEAIRLVERKAGVTSVRSLDEATVNRLERYLHDGDTLGDFIYGGGIDGFAE